MKNIEKFGRSYNESIAVLTEAYLKFYVTFEKEITKMILCEDKKEKENLASGLYEISKAFSFGFLDNDNSSIEYTLDDIQKAVETFEGFLSDTSFYFDVRDVFFMSKDEKNCVSVINYLSKDEEFKVFLLCLFLNKGLCHIHVLFSDMTNGMDEDVKEALIESGIIYLSDKFLESFIEDFVVPKSYFDQARKGFEYIFEGKL